MCLEACGYVRFAGLVLLLVACRPPGYGRHEVDAGTDGHAEDGHAAIDAASDAPAGCAHGFRLDGHGTATSVWLTGEFVNWGGTVQAGALPLSLGVDGGWTITHTFAAGTHLYKFIIDGSQWITDPTNPDLVNDGSGNVNSRYICTP